MPPPTLSSHLAQLERAGLVRSWRVERRIFYAVEVEGTRRLLRYLTDDCCKGQPELCGDLLKASTVCDSDRMHVTHAVRVNDDQGND